MITYTQTIKKQQSLATILSYLVKFKADDYSIYIDYILR